MKQTPITPPARDNLPNPIRTLVVDDSVVLLEGLCTYLEAQPLFQVIGTAMHGSEALPVPVTSRALVTQVTRFLLNVAPYLDFADEVGARPAGRVNT